MTSIVRFSIITPLTRGENVMAMYNSINATNFEWIIVVDGKSVGERFTKDPPILPNTKYYAHSSQAGVRGLSGNPQRNFGLERVLGDYVVFLDDDNIFNRDLFPRIEGIFEELQADGCNIPKMAFVVDQYWPIGPPHIRLRASRAGMHVGGTDTAQWVIPACWAMEEQWETHNYCADGVYISNIYHLHPGAFMFINEPLSYYNFLRRGR